MAAEIIHTELAEFYEAVWASWEGMGRLIPPGFIAAIEDAVAEG